jgi:hypothetical protein
MKHRFNLDLDKADYEALQSTGIPVSRLFRALARIAIQNPALVAQAVAGQTVHLTTQPTTPSEAPSAPVEALQ